MTKREKQLRDLRNKIARKEAQREAAIKTLVKVELELPKLRKQVIRMADRLFKAGTPVEEKPIANGGEHVEATIVDEIIEQGPPLDDLEIPAILDRNRKLQTLPDPKTKEKTAERRAIEKEVREAKLRGQTKKWPATGKEALARLK